MQENATNKDFWVTLGATTHNLDLLVARLQLGGQRNAGTKVQPVVRTS